MPEFPSPPRPTPPTPKPPPEPLPPNPPPVPPVARREFYFAGGNKNRSAGSTRAAQAASL
jgi:hypothetical protein